MLDHTDSDHRDGLTPAAAALLDQLEMWGQKLGLDRIRAILEALEHPESRFPVVLVGGTNGKGSTAAMLASILHAAGHRTGLFTSPHLESVRERIRVGGRAIGGAELSAALEAVCEAAGGAAAPPPTYFEAMTASALHHFASVAVDIAVLEVGLGGRLDATNATEPTLSVITSIAHDHQEHLGRRLDQIAREKVGIARPGRPLLVWAPRQAGVHEVLREVAATGVEVEESWRSLRMEDGAPAGSFRLRSGDPVVGDERLYTLRPGPGGAHQWSNAALAVRAAERLRDQGIGGIDTAAIEAGVARCRWPGRLEEVALGGGAAAVTVLLDGAHNLAGARVLARHLAASRGAGAAPLLVFGTLRRKKALPVLRTLAPGVGPDIVLTAPDSHRALPAGDLLRTLRRRAPRLARDCSAHGEPGDALAVAVERAEREGRTIVVCGSLYLVGEARTWLWRRFGAPDPAAEIPLFEPAATGGT